MKHAPIRLDYRPRAWQQECHRARRRFTVLALHRRAGKTELAIMELIDKAMKFQLELGMFVYIAPSALCLRQHSPPVVAGLGCWKAETGPARPA